jgi:uncharacterized tellurite resistance protein B-like protein
MEILEAFQTVEDVAGSLNDVHNIDRGIKAGSSVFPPSLPEQAPADHFLQEAPNPHLEWSASFCTNMYCGRKFVRKLVGNGTFLCPVCQQQLSYKQKELMIYCHLYWMPLCCGAHLSDYIKCTGCENHFNINVLDWAQGPQQAEKAFERAILDAMVLFMLAKSRALDALELANCKIRQIYHDMTNMTTEDEKIMIAHDARLKSTSEDFTMYFNELAHHLSQDQKVVIIKAVARLALADGHMDSKEAPRLIRVGKGLGVSLSCFKQIMRAEWQYPNEKNEIPDKTEQDEKGEDNL